MGRGGAVLCPPMNTLWLPRGRDAGREIVLVR